MRLPSDAQVAALALVVEYEETATPLYWPRHATGGEQDYEHRSRAALWTEHEDREANRGRLEPLGVSRSSPRTVTLHACIRHGWLAFTAERLVAQGLTAAAAVIGGERESVVLRELGLTEDGTLALGLWRQRKLTAPPAPTPTLDGRDREIVTLAEHAARLGFRLAPRTDQARADARRLKREGWVQRGHLGAGVRTLVPTAIGEVEVNPAAADTARPR